MKTFSILVIEDNQPDLRLIEEFLKESKRAEFKIVSTVNLYDGIRKIEQIPVDLIILDLNLPDYHGIDSLKELSKRTPYKPILVLTGNDDEELALETLQQGAQDYLIKNSVNAKLLERTILYAIERNNAHRRIEHLNLILKTIRNVNQLIIRERDQENLIQRFCDKLVETRGYHQAWIALFDKNRDLITFAQSGMDENILKILDEMNKGNFHACTKRAMETNEVIIFKEDAEECKNCPLFGKDPDNRAMTIKLESHNLTKGVLWVSVPKEFAYNNEEKELFKEISGDIAFALYSIDQEQSRKKVEERNRFQANVLNSVQNAVIGTDPGGVIQYWNKAAEKVYGWEDHEVIGKNINEVTVPQMSMEEAINIMNTLRNGESWAGEFKVKRRNGSTFDAIVSNSPIFDEKNELMSIIGVSTDITELKETQKKLKATNRALSALSASSSILIKSEDEFQLLSDVCSSIVEIAKYRMVWVGYVDYNEEKTITPVAQAGFEDGFLEEVEISWADNAKGRGPTGKAIRSGEPQLCKDIETDSAYKPWKEYAIKRGFYSSLSLPLFINNRTIGALNIYSAEKNSFDNKEVELLQELVNNLSFGITSLRIKEEKKKAREELKFMNRKLMIVNQELEEQTEQLKEAKEKAEQSDRLKSAFLANMSHEIRTPMNGIIGFSNLLEKENLTQEQKKQYLSLIKESGQQLLTIIHDIIDISKIESKEVKTDQSEIQLNKLLDELFAFFEPTAKDKHLELHLYKGLSGHKSIIKTDINLLKRILNNLISNAIKFTNAGTIEFGYHKEENEIEFFVRDTGIGIKPILKEVIFQRFRQADESITRQYGGTGLGLTISRAYTEMLGGKMWVESVYEKGSTFYFTIPFVTSKRLAMKKEKKVNNNATIFKDSVILLVEDDEINTYYFLEILKETGAHIIYARNGKEAIDKITILPKIDIILMDLKMPEMDGYQAFDEIRRIKKEIPIIAQTAYAMENDKRKITNYGFDGYLTKPIDKDILYSTLNNFLAGKTSGQQGVAR